MLIAGMWSLGAALSLVLGAVIAQNVDVSVRTIGETMGFGAGALLSALAYELLPSTALSDVGIGLSFSAGALVFYAADAALERRSAGADGADGAGEAIALGALLDGIPESLVLGMGLALGGSVNVAFLVAVFVSNIPESLGSTAALLRHMTGAAVYRLWIGIAFASGVAGAIGWLVADLVPTADGHNIQAFAAGSVLTMLAGSMMPEAFKEGGRRVALFTALGFAVATVLTMFD